MIHRYVKNLSSERTHKYHSGIVGIVNVFKKALHRLRTMRKHRLFTLIVISILLATSFWWFPYIFQPKKTEATWYNDNWGYRQIVAITNSGSAQTDYQIAMTLDTATLITAGKMLSTCNDVRVTDANGKVLPHVIEEGSAPCNNASTKIWTKVPSIPTSGVSLYIYYGNPSASSVANGSAVFDFFDDFDTNSLNTNVWTATGATSFASGAITITTGAVYSNNSILSSSTSYMYEYRSQWASTAVNYSGLEINNTISGSGSNTDGDKLIYMMSDAGTGIAQRGWANDTGTGYNLASNMVLYTPTAATYYIDGFSMDSTQIKFWNNGSQVGTTATGTWTGAPAPYMYLGYFLGSLGSTTDITDITVDWVRVRKYASTAPSAGSPSSEEKSPGPVAFWRLDDGTGTNAQDSTVNNNDGTLSGTTKPTWQTEDLCVSGKCLYFDGSTSYVRVDNSQLNNFGDFGSGTGQTLQAWVRTKSSAANMAVISLGSSSSDTPIMVLEIAGGMVRLNYRTDNGTETAGGSPYATTETVNDNKWHFITIVRSGTTFNIYIDGRLSTTATDGGSFNTLTANQQSIGVLRRTSAVAYYSGFIDEPKIYNYARSAAQVKADYAAGKSGAQTSKGSAASLGGELDQVNQTLSNGLVGYWKMDEASWTNNCSTASVLDSSGNGDNAMSCPNTSGPTGGNNGMFGNGGTFDANDDFVTVADNAVLDLSGDWTISSWFKTSTNTTQTIISKNLWSDRNYEMYVNEGWDDKIHVAYNSGGGNFRNTPSTVSVTDGLWHHAVGVYKSSTQSVTVYVDGVDVTGTPTGVNGSPAITTGNLYIGNSQTGAAGETFNGTLDELRVYNRALSPADVQTLYSFAPGPVGYWKMEEGTWNGTSGEVIDASGYGYNGTATGGPTTGIGKFGKGGSFDGSNDYISVAASNITGTAPTQESIMFWVNPSTTASTVGLFESADAVVDDSPNRLVVMNSGGTIKVLPCNVSYSSNTTTALSANTWSHIAWIRNGTSNKIYINGLQEVDSAITATCAFQTTQIATGYPTYFNGRLDEVKVYNYPRTQKQIVEDMNAGHPNVGSPVGSAVGYWKFDDGNGTTAQDSGTGGNDGTLINMASPATATSGWTNTGKFDKALVFDNSDDYVRIADAASLQPANISVSAWVFFTSTSGDKFVASKQYSTGTIRSFDLYIDNSNQLKFSVTNSAGTSVIAADPNTTFPNNTWVHVLGTYDGSTAKVYKNGMLVGNTSGSVTIGYDTNPVYIGASSYDADVQPDGFYSGLIDEVKLYGYALTDSEVKLDYNRSAAVVLGTTTEDQTSIALNQGLVGYWKMDEASWTNDCSTATVADSSGNANTGKSCPNTTGPTGGNAGKFGFGGTFDGTNDYVEVTNTSALQPTTALTISSWIKLTAFADRWMVSNQTSTFDINYGYQLREDTPTNTFLFSVGHATTSTTAQSTTTLSTGTWYHVVGVFNGSTSTIYINGTPEAVTSAGGSTIDYTGVASTMYIGARRDNGFFTNGVLDEMRIYNRALSPSEVQRLYTSSIQGLVAEWKLDEHTGTTTNDTSGNNRTGTLMSSPVWTTGKFGSALKFNGSSDYVKLESASNIIQNVSLYSIAAWVYPTSFASTMEISDFTINGSNTSRADFYIAGSSGKPAITARAPDAQAGQTLTSDGAVSLNTWSHVAIVIDVANDSGTFYINGVKQTATGALTFTQAATDNTTSNSTVIGVDAAATVGFFTGSIDAVQVYNTALTQFQIAQLYNRGGPIGWWKLDECQGTTANDASGQENNGTIVPFTGGTTAVGTCATSATSMWYNGRNGKLNSSLAFDGTDDYVWIADTTNLRFDASTQDFSLFAWVKRTTTGTEYILSKEDADNDGWRLVFNSSNQVLCSEDATDVTSLSGITDTNWHHIGCTIIRNGNGQVYIDGLPNGLPVAMGTDAMATTAIFRIATRAYTPASFFNGQIDDVRLYSYALTKDQVKVAMNEGAVRWGPISGTP